MINKDKLKQYVSEQLNQPPENLVWSKVCVNPSEGFDIGIDNTQKPRALGYWVVK